MGKKKNMKWTFELVHKEALKYKTRVEFQRGNRAAYNWAYRKKILDDTCSHMKKSNKNKRTEDSVQKEALKYTSRIEFMNNSRNDYSWAMRNKLLDKVCSHMEKRIVHNKKYYLDNVKEEALKYKNRRDFKEKSYGEYQWAVNNKKLDIVCSHMKKKFKELNLDLVKKEALKYVIRKEFRMFSTREYVWAWKNNCIEEVCSHMEKYLRKIWTLESVQKEAKKYYKRNDFKRGSSGAYNWAQERKLLDKVCVDMKSPMTGFNDNIPGLTYYIRINKDGNILYKIGITNRSIDRRFGSEMKYITIIEKWEYQNGADARKLEKEILTDYSYARYKGPNILDSGNTEMFIDDILMLDKEVA